MKKLIFILAVCISGCLSMTGQSDNAQVIKRLEASADDYIPLLQSSGYEAFPFDIASLTDGKYYLSFKIREYKAGKVVNEDILGGYSTFVNMCYVSEFSKEDQENIKPEEMADPERGIYMMSKKIMVGFSPVVNDSIRPIIIDVENMGAQNFLLPMSPQYQNNDSINGKKLYNYLARPFKTGEFSTGQFIPLVLLGSMWYDKNFGVHRFCGEAVIDPDMSSKILKYIPHYYL